MNIAKPFLKWAGGKKQLLEQIKAYLPPHLQTGQIAKFAEPFIGGGAVFFSLSQHTSLQTFFISDRNRDLILTYRAIQQDVEALIACLAEMQERYWQLNEEERKETFYATRSAFNQQRGEIDFATVNEESLLRAAQLIFLNRTCFNGLYRVNKKGAFNVPFGRYKKPRICHEENLRLVAQVLAQTTIQQGDFEDCRHFVDEHTFVYFDPPYRPLSSTANFNTYAQLGFNDEEQKRLAQFYRELHEKGAWLMLSNADPHNENPEDDFFEELYAGFSIHKVTAKRAINSNTGKRGEITELLITNY